MKKKELFMDDLEHLFKSDLKHIYYVEKEHANAMVRIIKASTDPEIKETLGIILGQCLENKDRIEKIFENIKIKPRGKKSKGIEGMIDESKEIISKQEKLTYVIVDAALLSAIQRILFYKIAAYKTLKNYAKLTTNNLAVNLFDACYNDSRESEKKISRLLYRRVRPKSVELY